MLGTAGWIGIVAAAILLVWAAWVFNRLVALGNRADNAWSDVEVQLKRRRDLIPALVETVRGYSTHESETLERAVRARGDADRAAERVKDEGAEPLARAETEVGRAAVSIVALAEDYPDLKADGMFRDLSTRLVETEDALSKSRRYFNAVVRDLNIVIESFPSLVIARLTGKRTRAFFELEDPGERAAPAVDLS